MLFKLTNKNSDRMTHCGVLEFVADEGICYLPHWVSCLMLHCQNLKSRISELPGLILRRWNISCLCWSLQQPSVLAQASLHRNLTKQSRLLLTCTWVFFLKLNILIDTGERFENVRHVERALCVCFSILADDAEFAAGRRRPGAGGECESASCYLLKISATESRFSWHHQSQSCVSFLFNCGMRGKKFFQIGMIRQS